MDQGPASTPQTIETLLKNASVLEVDNPKAYIQNLSDDEAIGSAEKVKLVASLIKKLGDKCFVPRKKRYLKKRDRPVKARTQSNDSTSSEDEKNGRKQYTRPYVQYRTRKYKKYPWHKTGLMQAPLKAILPHKEPVDTSDAHIKYIASCINKINYMSAMPNKGATSRLPSVNQLETIPAAKGQTSRDSSPNYSGMLCHQHILNALKPVKMPPPVRVIPWKPLHLAPYFALEAAKQAKARQLNGYGMHKPYAAYCDGFYATRRDGYCAARHDAFYAARRDGYYAARRDVKAYTTRIEKPYVARRDNDLQESEDKEAKLKLYQSHS